MAKVKKIVQKKGKLDTSILEQINISNFTVKPKIADLQVSEAQRRLASHMAFLEPLGYKSLDELGKLNFKNSGIDKKPLYQPKGIVIHQDKIVSPQEIPFSLKGSLQVFSFEKKIKKPISSSKVVSRSAKSAAIDNVLDTKKTGKADLIITQPFRQLSTLGSNASLKMSFNINMAFWFAPEINIEDDTDIILASDVKNLVIITNSLKVGNNVTITWDRPGFSNKAIPQTPAKPSGFPTATALGAETGRAGLKGFAGSKGDTGADAPEIEVWFLDIQGDFPIIDLKGQTGQDGVKGGNGGPGGDGQKGSSTEIKGVKIGRKVIGACAAEQGGGGNGGIGGPAGNGGSGGNGGNGGRLSIYTTTANILSISNSGMTTDLSFGEGGSGNSPGNPGQGGQGGAKGDKLHSVCQNNNRTAGSSGALGHYGISGEKGDSGITLPNNLKLNAITLTEFNIALTKPAIISTNKQGLYAYIGDTVTVYGTRFANGDKVHIEGMDGGIDVECDTSVVAENLLSFTISPQAIGGLVNFIVKQIDGTGSVNKGTILIRPKIEKLLPSNRIRPQSIIFIKGSGFGDKGYITINNEDCGAFELVEPGLIKYTVFRPSNVIPNESGENITLKVINYEGHGIENFNHSNEISAILDTYRIVVFGDSSIYNGGNVEYNKFYSKVKDYIASKNNIGVYLTVKAHQGAIIGRGLTTQYVPFHGELSTDYPTINQQVEEISNLPDAKDIDLVLMTGGANDSEILRIMLESNAYDLTNLEHEFKDNIEKYCHIDLKDLVLKARSSFPKANILVNGYYHIFSEYSDASKVTLLAITLYSAIKEIDNDDIVSLLTTGTFNGMPPNLSINLSVDKIRRLNSIWVEESTKKIKTAVNEANEVTQGDSTISFIDLETQPNNAAHAPQSLLWEPIKEALLLKPSDPMEEERLELVRQVKDRCEAGEFSEQDLKNRGYGKKNGFLSKKNSSYHPNVQGAQRYFDKMKPVIDKFEINRKIVIKSFNGNKIRLSNQKLIASNLEASDLSVFELVKVAGNKIALKAQNGLYVCAEQGGGTDVNVNRAKAKEWESFEIVSAGAGYFAFKTINNFYLSVQVDGVINAQGNVINDAVKFQVF